MPYRHRDGNHKVKPVKITKIPGGVRLTLPLDWTDIVLLPSR